jgi:hypothetical protein
MASRISLNIHGNNAPDRQRLLDHLQILQPPAVLVLDNLDLAREIKKLLPNTTSIFREFGSKGDGALHLDSDPKSWLDRHAHQAEGGIVLHVLNEPPFDQAVVDWLTELLRLAAPRRIPLIIGNWAVGNPLPEQWAMAREMLQLLDQHRDLFILGLHEYAGGVVTSGLYGGYPDNAGVKPGTSGGKNLIPPGNWPKDVSDATRYHMGRFKFLMSYCDSIGIRCPRIILTEHGFDDTSDIKAWEDTLKKNSPYLNVRGWKTLHNQWTDWYGGLGWSPERAYFEQLAWADRTIYQNSPVEAQCIFCWGHSSQEWDQFDIAQAQEFQRLLEDYARQGAAFKPAEFAPSTPPPASEARMAATPATPEPEATLVAPPSEPTKPRVTPIGQRSAEEIASAGNGTTISPVGVRVDNTAATAPSTPTATFVGSVVTPHTLEEAFTNDEIAALAPALRAASSSGTFSQAINDGFTRLAAMLEQVKNERA